MKKNPLIILNPTACSDRAGVLADRMKALPGNPVVELTTSPGDAEEAARAGVLAGYQTIVAAGGDGTINEVVNGMGGQHDHEGVKIRLGILPVGTMNVFASELGLPMRSLEQAWQVITEGVLRHVDLPRASGRYFVQLAGVGLDAEVVRRTSREAKRALGPLSYLVSLAQVATNAPPQITVRAEAIGERTGSFILMGNGKLYGGPFKFFRNGSQQDGLLDVLVFKNQSPWDLLRYMQAIMMGQHANLPDVEYFQTPFLTMEAAAEVPFELDGEMAGYLPLEVSLERGALSVLVPKAKIKTPGES